MAFYTNPPFSILFLCNMRVHLNQTKKINGDALLDNVSKVVGPWDGGKLMSFTA